MAMVEFMKLKAPVTKNINLTKLNQKIPIRHDNVTTYCSCSVMCNKYKI